MEKDVLSKIKEEANTYPELGVYYEIINETLADEYKSLNDGFYIKICEVPDSRDDGVYINKSGDVYYINNVRNSIRNPKKAEYDDIVGLIAYSYIVRITSYAPNSPFKMVKYYTKKIEEIVNKYK